MRTTTTWGGDWAEFVIFLARLQALGYSGVNADEIVVAAGDSKTPEWARGVSGGGDDAAAGADSRRAQSKSYFILHRMIWYILTNNNTANQHLTLYDFYNEM